MPRCPFPWLFHRNILPIRWQKRFPKGPSPATYCRNGKYAHVTFFFNGGREEVFPGEDRILVPSPHVATYDLQPEMSAYIVTEKLQEALDQDLYDLIILNFANPDMVGHTGVMKAAVAAMEAVDECVGGLVDKILQKAVPSALRQTMATWKKWRTL